MTAPLAAPGRDAAPLRLDDLTWEAMTEAIRRRIPAESGGRWTLHAPTDPGVTLLELFAYLLEQRLYWLDQVPDELVVAVLRLLGLPAPRPARPAATVLQLTVAPGAGPGGEPAEVPVVVAAGTVLSRDPLERITFTLDEDVAVVPLAGDGLRLLAGDADRSADLLARRGVPVLSADGGPAEFRVVLRRRGDRRPPRDTRLSLLFELDVPARVPPSFAPDAVADVTPPAALSWSWFRPDRDGSPIVLRGPDVADGTAGLRRTGVVRLRLPDDWCAGGAGDAPQEYGLRVGTDAATYSAPPRLLQIAPNVGAARHRETRTVTQDELADQILGWLRLPGQHLTLPDTQGLLLEAVLWLRRDGRITKWTAAPALTFGGPADRIFLIDRDAGELRFGNGLTGAIPVPDPIDEACAGDEPVVAVEYAIGGGTAGNGGQTANWLVIRPPAGPGEPGPGEPGPGEPGPGEPGPGEPGPGEPRPGALVTARNVVPAVGGREAETVAEARRRAGEELERVHRAVIAEDFAELAEATPGVAVARAHVGVGEHPSYPCTTVPGAVTVRVLPAVRRAAADFETAGFVAEIRPDPGLLHEVREHLEEARLIGSELFVCPPRYRRVDLRVDLAGRPGDAALVRTTLRATLRRYLDPLVGGDDGRGWPFGGPLRPSALLRVAQAALGDAAEVSGVAVGLDGAEPAEDCTDVPLRPGELAALEQIAVRVGRAVPREALL